MRIAAISDIHGNLAALNAVLETIAAEKVDIVVNLGDILSGPLQPAETADRLMALGLPTIRGNHERQLLTLPSERMGLSDRYAHDQLTARHRDWLTELPHTLQLSDDILLCHGTPSSDLEYYLESVDEHGARPATQDEIGHRSKGVAQSLILCGHTHCARVCRLGDGQLIVNPGSVGLQAYEDDQPIPHKIEMGTPHARYAIIERHRDAWNAELRSVEYDWDAMAELAAKRNRNDWAVALRTGRV